MINLYLKDIALILNAKLIGNNCKINSISIDSRKIFNKKNCLFIAIKGKKFNGECFIKESIKNGAVAVINARKVNINIPHLIVKNTIISLLRLSKWIRENSKAKIIAITGSSGKTSVKEIIFNILNTFSNTIATKKNFNNNIGVPLTLLRLNKNHNFAIIEVGGNKFGEIKTSSNLIKPDIALINNISESHLSGFKSINGVSKAKEEIFSGIQGKKNGIIVLNYNSNDWKEWKKKLKDNLVFWFGIIKNKKKYFYLKNIKKENFCIKFSISTQKEECEVSLPLIGYHNLFNAMAAIAISFLVGASMESIKYGLKKSYPFKRRLFPIFLNKNKIIIDDSYNANVGSMISAISVLNNMPGYKIIIIGDILELGKQKEIIIHKNIGFFISKSKINKVFSIGYLSYFSSIFSKKGKHFYNIDYLISETIKMISRYPIITVLIKGSNKTDAYNIVKMLQESARHASMVM
ncbi:murF [Wigglesworthia glossinidia endosymbiont of Glossina brevipalpis]|uniref:UDP-N-acetylmuramoyl-tripeptide--D-alanyl-D-alanine ligase n=1 Tax=Wigglesworthia glossinidia brevipalpis TaxID=36870 RepID=Q8D2Z2_WIGBR|nr:murF [Wigglesworthia glossinidia endosymbiont of Glossina brevipalpis]